MSLCENCKSLDVCTAVDINKEDCFFFSPTEDYRIRNSKEYAIGYEKGRADERNSFFNFDEVIKIECDKARADERAKVIDEFVNALINPSNYERYDFDECLDDSNKANDFFKYVFAMAEKLKERSNE